MSDNVIDNIFENDEDLEFLYGVTEEDMACITDEDLNKEPESFGSATTPNQEQYSMNTIQQSDNLDRPTAADSDLGYRPLAFDDDISDVLTELFQELDNFSTENQDIAGAPPDDERNNFEALGVFLNANNDKPNLKQWKLHIEVQPSEEFQYSTRSDITQKGKTLNGSSGRHSYITLGLNCDHGDAGTELKGNPVNEINEPSGSNVKTGIPDETPGAGNDVITGIKQIWIWCTLCLFGRNKSQSSHLLLKNDSKETLILLPTTQADGKYQVQIKNLHIVKTKPNDNYNVLCKKYEEYEKFKRQSDVLNEDEKERIKNIATEDKDLEQEYLCLSFQAVTMQDGKYIMLTERIFSNSFAEKPHITEIKPTAVDIRGGCNMLITSKQTIIPADNISIRLFESRVESNQYWEYTITENIIFKNANVLSFQAPPYQGTQTSAQSIECKLQLIWANGRQSKPIKFLYRNAQALSARKRQHLDNDPSETQPKHRTLHTDSISTEKDTAIIFNIQKALLPRSDLEAQRNLERVNNNFLRDNNYHENIFHCVCENRKYQLIRPLLRHMVHLICEQNQAWETPLHVALRIGDQACLEIFSELFICYFDYSANVEAALKELLHVYDDEGHTVLHQAVIRNDSTLVEAILEFCQLCGVDTCAIATLNDGNTILHLAVSNNLRDMQELITKILPNVVEYENYAGERPICRELDELDELSDMLAQAEI